MIDLNCNILSAH